MFGIITSNNEYNNKILKILIKYCPVLIGLYVLITRRKIKYEKKSPFVIARIPIRASLIKFINSKVLAIYYKKIFKSMRKDRNVIKFYIYSKNLNKNMNNNIRISKELMLVKIESILTKIYKIYKDKNMSAVIIDRSFSYKSIVIINALKEKVKSITLITDDKELAGKDVKEFEDRFGLSIYITDSYNVINDSNGLIIIIESKGKINNNDKSVVINFEQGNNYNNNKSYVINKIKNDVVDERIRSILNKENVDVDYFISRYITNVIGQKKEIISDKEYNNLKKNINEFIKIRQIF